MKMFDEEDRVPVVDESLGRPLYPWERARLREAAALRNGFGAMVFEPREAPRNPTRLSESVKARKRAGYLREGFTPAQADEMAEVYCAGYIPETVDSGDGRALERLGQE